MNVHVRSLTQFKLKYWTLPCLERFKFGAGDPVVSKTAHPLPVMVHGACAIMRVSVVSGKLMLVTGKAILKVLEARYDFTHTKWEIFLELKPSKKRALRELGKTFDGPTVS